MAYQEYGHFVTGSHLHDNQWNPRFGNYSGNPEHFYPQSAISPANTWPSSTSPQIPVATRSLPQSPTIANFLDHLIVEAKNDIDEGIKLTPTVFDSIVFSRTCRRFFMDISKTKENPRSPSKVYPRWKKSSSLAQ